MKSKLLIILGLFSFSALAAGNERTPTGDKVQFQIVVEADVCSYDKNGEIQECTGVGESDRIRDNVSGELMQSTCRPACKYNDSMDITKSYTLKREINGQKISVEVTAIFSRLQLSRDPVPEYYVELTVTPSGGEEDDSRSALATTKDVTTFGDLSLSGKSIKITNPDGSYSKITPSAYVGKIQISK